MPYDSNQTAFGKRQNCGDSHTVVIARDPWGEGGGMNRWNMGPLPGSEAILHDTVMAIQCYVFLRYHRTVQHKGEP